VQSTSDAAHLTGVHHPSADRERFLALTLPHAGAVHAIARRNTRDPHHAEDVTQETYLRAYAAFRSHRGTSTRAWLVAICLNVLREQSRRRASRPAEVLSDEPWDAATESDQPFNAAAARDERRRIAAALETLRPEQREAILLVDIAGLTHQEAADAVGCPRGTMLARVHRGRVRLGQLLAPEVTPHEL
jgi:RNA polymerase sigma-70 factor (ECF subfamily)